MRRISKKSNILLLICCGLATACNQGGPPDTPVAPQEDTVKKVSADPQVERVIGGKLDTLYIDSLGFDTVPKRKLVFSFIFDQMDKLTIHGWSKRIAGRDFNDPPNLKLLNGQPSTFNYGPGTYFGAVIIPQDDVIKIKQIFADTKSKYVLFAPEIIGDHIYYHIYVTVDDPGVAVKTRLATATGVVANPSPPKSQ